MSDSLMCVDPATIQIKPQVRKEIDANAIDRLAQSIASCGLQQPIRCFRDTRGHLIVIDGHCRLLACKQLGLNQVAVLVVEAPFDDVELLVQQLVANVQRTDLSPIEKAQGIRSLMDLASLTVTQVSERLGLSPASVSRALRLLTLSPELRERVATGELPADSAYQLSRVADEDERLALADQVTSKSLSRDDLVRRVKRGSHPGRGPRAAVPRAVLSLSQGIALRVSGQRLTLDVLISSLEEALERAHRAKTNGETLEVFAELRGQGGEEASTPANPSISVGA